MITHELKKIITAFESALQKNQQAVLATVVALDGSSYRRPGVRMLLLEDGKMIGAVSGGCVEKEVFRQAESVFKTGMAKVMTYDGRYRLGCEGILYILLEPFLPESEVLKTFWATISSRKSFEVESHFEKKHVESEGLGSFLVLGNERFPFRKSFQTQETMPVFRQVLLPCFKLVIIGAEHDAVQLCAIASMTGWEVTIVANPKEEKTITDFPGATEFVNKDPENLRFRSDKQTAIILMTHSYVKDLQYLINLKDHRPAYMGVLGPSRRREKLFNELLDQAPETTIEFIEAIHGPAGLDLGAETPQEIAISILAEILTVINKAEGIPLKNKEGRIHA